MNGADAGAPDAVVAAAYEEATFLSDAELAKAIGLAVLHSEEKHARVVEQTLYGGASASFAHAVATTSASVRLANRRLVGLQAQWKVRRLTS